MVVVTDVRLGRVSTVEADGRAFLMQSMRCDPRGAKFNPCFADATPMHRIFFPFSTSVLFIIERSNIKLDTVRSPSPCSVISSFLLSRLSD
jgi:hypothetical protein